MKLRPRKPKGTLLRNTNPTKSAVKVSKPITKSQKSVVLFNLTEKPRRGYQECIICATNKPTGRLRSSFLKFDSCAHEPLTCTECMVKHIIITLESRELVAWSRKLETLRTAAWSLCACAQCGASLNEKTLYSKLPPADWNRIEAVISRKAFENHPRWIWCTSPHCSSGQLHQIVKKGHKNPKMICETCGKASCFHHRLPWHEGYTCEMFDISHPLAPILRSNEEVIKSISKKCPGCKRRVEKDGGCNRMFCIKCSKSWDWGSVRYDR